MTDKAQGLQTIRNIMSECQISMAELQAFISEKPSTKQSSLIVQLMAYLGGVLVLCGICIYVGMQWEQMNSLTRVLVTLGSGVVAFIMAILVLNEPKFEKLITPLFIVAALLELGGMFVFLDEYFTPTGKWEQPSMLVHSVVGIQFGLAFYALKRDALLFVVVYCAAMFFGAWFEYMDVDHEITLLLIGGALLVTAFFVQRTQHAVITPLWYFFGAFMFLFALFDLVEKSLGEILFVAANIGLIYLSIYARSRTLLFVGIVSFFAYMSYTAHEYFLDSTGWPLMLIALGLLLFGLSALGVKINQKYLKD